MLNELFVHFTGRLIAIARLFLAILILGFGLTDFNTIGFRPETDDYLALGYLGFALIATLIAWRSWWWDFWVSGFGTVADWIFFLSFIIVVPIFQRGFEIPVVGCVAYLQIALRLRWSAAAGQVGALALMLLWILYVAFDQTIHLGSDPVQTLRSIVIVTITTAAVAFFSANVMTISVPSFEPSGPAVTQALIPEMLEYAMREIGAGGAAIVWQNLRNVGQSLGRAGSLGDEVSQFKPPMIAESAQPLPRAILFDRRTGRVLVLRKGNKPAVESHFLEAQWSDLEKIGAHTGLCAPIQGIDSTNWLVLANVHALSWGLFAPRSRCRGRTRA